MQATRTGDTLVVVTMLVAGTGIARVQYAKLMRVMKRQADGTWRFARVMGLPAPSASAVVLKHPCQ